MTWRDLLAALQSEIQQHTLSTFRDDPGAKGVLVTGCPKCRKKFQTTRQLVEHITGGRNTSSKSKRRSFRAKFLRET